MARKKKTSASEIADLLTKRMGKYEKELEKIQNGKAMYKDKATIDTLKRNLSKDQDRLNKVKKSYPNFSMGGPQEVNLPEATADTSNLYTGAFSNIKARRYSKKNPGAKGISYKPSGGFRKRRKTTTYQDGQKADIVKRLGI